ncbi:NCS1 family nucleobase:cation symporter-1 [Streptomyces sp. HNM0663]|uniref:NCS1 family nucleobase:cation symporter-1 n=2 Tax=Streptomyces chengmaiensis TaxID=3040919 RepID=A0ABT6HTL0_9ACTN|nr:NCS1 family nucleobase:cation symporter-1 [Streptomyces chengmaiensis]MDH2392040.1 NCS1 family nucleobase:cation symporter-1 [Streptomyces chengmaiensis]
MPMTAISPQTTAADGRVELAPGAYPADSPFSNADLHPVPLAERRWTTYNFAALWIGMAVNIPSWTLASGLVALGMDWKQAVLTIALGNVIVLLPMLLTGHAGPKYGIPFPVLARASFGLRGANLPALLRGLAACAWFGIQTWIGGASIYFLAGRIFGAGGWWTEAGTVAGYPWTQWLCFLLFFAIEIVIILRGMEAVRRLENWAAPLMLAGALALLWWIAAKAGGFGPLLDQPSQLGWGGDFWKVFFPALMGMVGFWSTLSLNIPDFTRFGVGQRAQVWGQSLGLPTTMAAFALLSVLVTSGSQAVYGEPIWDPSQLAARMDSTAGVVFALLVILLATLSTNIAANLVSPAYDLSNIAPRLITFRTGALIACVVGVVIFPWKLIENPDVYIFTWLGTVGGLLGTVAGILIADYWLLRRTRLELAGLYTEGSVYWYSSGWNPRAVTAFAVGAVLAVGGSYSAPGRGPFPEDGLIPFLKPLADYGWAVGLAASLALYLLLMAPGRARRPDGRRPDGRRPGGR